MGFALGVHKPAFFSIAFSAHRTRLQSASVRSAELFTGDDGPRSQASNASRDQPNRCRISSSGARSSAVAMLGGRG
ncbi:MAG: hypothetical protein LAN64_20590 [Acidobacteriia bacterium]|nr:hypothetical protein [Terriglobia bacterium]